MYIRIRYELESFQALKQNNDVDRVLGLVLDQVEKLVKIAVVLKNCPTLLIDGSIKDTIYIEGL